MRRKWWVSVAGWLCLCVIIPATAVGQYTAIEPVAETKQIAVVIDDFGNGQAGTEQMMELPIPFVAAVMPFLPTTKRDAEWAHKLGKEVIVHLPMEPRNGKPEWLGPGAISTRLPDDEIRRRVIAAIEDVPHAVGINNHMGSKATSNERVMRIVLTVCKERNLYFLDSRTTDKSVIGKLAKEMGVRTAENNLFMDDTYTRNHILKQAVKLQKLVRDNDSTIVIGHVGPPGKHTSEILKQSIPTLQQLGGHFVPASQLMK
ncbi:divergent polysaccharide deacetylase family protein [Paenibacillus sp. MZ04-78.2]|uniref:divergent polysaccharide deacetylase family protein n=1 Tax=Paenibacillus sp. MZ04-78.2 TaxID=2962034 RepID=UPI0020B66CC2|nr:divergent polysaccharide deacetylase family protein [Paenibacillus sp. MZ04-78.2]MCP3775580.1 divergent polysaccharide deacetylase family protein [Paenibacillus sp. MZ04-78.2]